MNFKRFLIPLLPTLITGVPVSASAQSYLSQLDQAYLNDVNRLSKDNPLRSMVSDLDKIKAAHLTCQQLDNGKTVKDLDNEAVSVAIKVDNKQDSDYLIDFISSIQVSAIYNYCPQYKLQLSD